MFDGDVKWDMLWVGACTKGQSHMRQPVEEFATGIISQITMSRISLYTLLLNVFATTH